MNSRISVGIDELLVFLIRQPQEENLGVGYVYKQEEMENGFVIDNVTEKLKERKC